MKKRLLIFSLMILSLLAVAAKPPMKVDSLVVAEKDVTSFFENLDTDNQLTSSGIDTGSIDSSKLQDYAVSADKLDKNAVTTEKIANGAVTTEKLDTEAVTVTKIAKDAVGSSQLQAEAVDSSKIKNYNVTTNKIYGGSVTTAKLAVGSVSESRIADNAVTTSKIDAGAVTTERIADDAVTQDKIANVAVGSGQLAANSILTVHLSQQVADLLDVSSRVNIGADGITLEIYVSEGDTLMRVVDGGISTAKLTDGAVTGTKLADGAVSERHVGNYQITEDKIDSWAVSRSKIRDYAVNSLKLDSAAVRNEKIAPGAVTTDKISDLQVTTQKLADEAVTHDKLDEDAVTTPKIRDRNVTESKLADGAISYRTLNDSLSGIFERALETLFVPDDSTVEIVAIGPDSVLRVKDKGISTAKLADEAVTAAKLDSALIADIDLVETSEIDAGAVTTTGILDSTILMCDLDPEVMSQILTADTTVFLGENITFVGTDDNIQTAIDTLSNLSITNWHIILLAPGDHQIFSEIRMRPFVCLQGFSDVKNTRIGASSGSGLTTMISADSAFVMIKNLEIYNANSYGTENSIIEIGMNIGNDFFVEGRYSVIENVRIDYSYNNTHIVGGIEINGGMEYNYLDRFTVIRKCFVHNRYANGNIRRGSGIVIRNTGGNQQNEAWKRLLIEGCEVYDCAYGYTFHDSQFEQNFLVDCIAQDCQVAGIFFSGTVSAIDFGNPSLYVYGGDYSGNGDNSFYTSGQTGYTCTLNVMGALYDNGYAGSNGVINYLDFENFSANDIPDSSVTWPRLSAAVMDSIKASGTLQDGAVNWGHLSSAVQDSILNNEIPDGSINAAKLDADVQADIDTVENSELSANAVTTDKILDGEVNWLDLAISVQDSIQSAGGSDGGSTVISTVPIQPLPQNIAGSSAKGHGVFVSSIHNNTALYKYNSMDNNFITEDAVFDGKFIWVISGGNTLQEYQSFSPGGYEWSSHTHTKGTFAFKALVWDGQYIWAIPHKSDSFMKFDPLNADNETYYSNYNTSTSGAFIDACFDGEYIWCAPSYITNLVKFSPASPGIQTNYAIQDLGASDYSGICFDGDNLWLSPNNGDYVVKVDRATGDTTRVFTHGEGNYAYKSCLFDGKYIWFCPEQADSLIRINKETEEVTKFVSPEPGYAFADIVFDGNSVWLVPRIADYFYRVDRETGVYQRCGTSAISNDLIYLALYAGDTIYGFNQYATERVYKFRTDLVGQSHAGIFTGGDGMIGGDLVVNGAGTEEDADFRVGAMTNSSYINAGGNAWLTTSDSTLKKDITEISIPNVYEKFQNTPFHRFHWKAYPDSVVQPWYYGLIAQEWGRYFKNDSTLTEIDYSEVRAAMWVVIQKLISDVEALQDSVAVLKEDVEAIKP